MTPDLDTLKDELCRRFCGDVAVRDMGNDAVQIALPFSARDGDGFTTLVQRKSAGWLIHDAGTTMMRLSYEHDVNDLLAGTRGRLFEQILTETGLTNNDGELGLEVAPDALMHGLFTFGQGLTRIYDLTLWTRLRTENTFQDDLARHLRSILGDHEMIAGYSVPGVADADHYLVDFYIPTPRDPLYLFAVSGKDKARLATIVLERLLRTGLRFDSMVVFQNAEDVPRKDVSRLMNAANDMIASADALQDLDRKLLKKIAV